MRHRSIYDCDVIDKLISSCSIDDDWNDFQRVPIIIEVSLDFILNPQVTGIIQHSEDTGVFEQVVEDFFRITI